jgi:hypothetical protein
MPFDLEHNKWIYWAAGGAVLIAIIAARAAGSKSDSSTQTQTAIPTNLGGSPDIPLAQIGASNEQNLALISTKSQGFSNLLNYYSTDKALDTQSKIQSAQIAGDLEATRLGVGRDLELGRLAAATEMSAIQSQVQIAGITTGGQVQIAGIEGAVASERTRADRDIAFRGYDSADFGVSSAERTRKAELATGERIAFGGFDLEKYLADIGLSTVKFQEKHETKRTRIGANRDVSLAEIESTTTLGTAKLQADAQKRSGLLNFISGLAGAILPAFL